MPLLPVALAIMMFSGFATKRLVFIKRLTK